MASGLSSLKASRLSASTAAAALENREEAAAAWRGAALDYDEEEAGAGGRRRAPFDVFINHRGADTKKTVAGLLHDRLVICSLLRRMNVKVFMDNKSMHPGDRLMESIEAGIRECGVAVAIFSRNYLESEFCLHELAMIVEARPRKVIIPIFYDVKPSQLELPQSVLDSGDHTPDDIRRFRAAIREVRHIVGLSYDSATGDLAELVTAACNSVLENIEKLRSVQRRQMIPSRL